MRICRFTLNAHAEARPRLGLMEAGGVRDVTAATQALPALRWMDVPVSVSPHARGA